MLILLSGGTFTVGPLTAPAGVRNATLTLELWLFGFCNKTHSSYPGQVEPSASSQFAPA